MLTHGDHHTNARALLAFLVVILFSAMIFVLLYNIEELYSSGRFNLFYVLMIAGVAALFSVLFLASKPLHKKGSMKRSRRK